LAKDVAFADEASRTWEEIVSGQIQSDAAEALFSARAACSTIAPLRESWPGLTDGDAYVIQRLNVDRRIAAGGRVVGRKIGLTSLAVQKQLGVSQPDFGALFSEDVHGDNAAVALSGFIQPRAEAEIALILGRDLAIDRPCWSDLVRAVDCVLPAIEIVDSVIAGWRIGFLDTVADNASGGAVVLGGPVRPLAGLDLGAMAMSLSRDGRTASSGRGSDCLGHPLSAAVWLARTLSALGDPLRAGDLIMTGALGPMVALPGPCAVSALIEGLGTVSVQFVEGPAA
jgi:2-keto-4-pentenoate hydratase